VPLGEEFFVTIRIPNPSLEELERVIFSIDAGFMANYYSLKLTGLQAVKWFVLPMVEDVEVVKTIQRIITRKEAVLREELRVGFKPVQIVPLLEDSLRHIQVNSYVKTLLRVLKELGVEVEKLRVFLGKSDAAVKSGHLASMLSIKYALSSLSSLSKEIGIKVEPIIGMGSPPFRGGLNNSHLVKVEAEFYAGYSTVTIQSAVRYDVPFKEYLVVKETVLSNLGKTSSELDGGVIEHIISASRAYRGTASKYIEVIRRISDVVPLTRDRVSWRKYSRLLPGHGELFSVPRAISYTCAWYSVGIPPTLLDASYILNLHREDKLDEVLKIAPNLIEEWKFDSKFYIREVALSRLNEYIVKLVDNALDVLGIKPEPLEPYRLLLRVNPVEPHILAHGKLRGFLG